MRSNAYVSAFMTWMEKIIGWILTIMIAVMVVNIAAGVFARFVLSTGLPWTEELGRYLMIWAGYLGTVLALKEGSHISVTFITDAFPPAFRKVFLFLSRVVITVFLIIIVITSFQHIGTLDIQRSSAMEIPMAVPYLSVTVGAFLMVIVNILRLLGFADAETDAEPNRNQI